MEDSLLIQNDLKRVHISTPLLFVSSLGNAVMMGILFYSGQTLSLSGRTPLPAMMGNVAPKGMGEEFHTEDTSPILWIGAGRT